MVDLVKNKSDISGANDSVPAAPVRKKRTFFNNINKKKPSINLRQQKRIDYKFVEQ